MKAKDLTVKAMLMRLLASLEITLKPNDEKCIMIYPWQKPIWQRIFNQHQQNRLPHAILCKGPEGIGKLEFALYLAKTILCETKGQACTICRSCQLFQSGNHPDFFEVRLLEKAKEIKIDQIRLLCDSLNLTAHHQGYQIALIYPAECMNRASANALLKTLEEPPGNVLIILVAHQLSSLPQTILSRCQCLEFSLPKEEAVLPWLQDSLAIEKAQAKFLFYLAEWAPIRARMLGQNDVIKLRNFVLRGLWQLLNDEVIVLEIVDKFLKENMMEVLQVIFSIAMDVIRLQVNFSFEALQNQDVTKQLTLICQKINVVLLAQYLPQLLQDQHRLQHVAGVNVQLLMEGVLLRWQNLRGNI